MDECVIIIMSFLCVLQEIVVLNIDRHAPFPMQIGVNVMCVTPPQPVVETAESLTLQQPTQRQQQLSGQDE